MASITPSCEACGKAFGNQNERQPLVLGCMCVLCRGCIVEAGMINDGNTACACISCGASSTISGGPLYRSLPHLAAAAAAASASGGSVGASSPPLCDTCGEEHATAHCAECAELYCDECRKFNHRSAKRQGHTVIPIKDFLCRQPEGADMSTAGIPLCQIHPEFPCDVFCETCGMLICAKCGIKDHNGHALISIDEVHRLQEHRDVIDSAVATTAAVRADVLESAGEIKETIKGVETNRKASEVKLLHPPPLAPSRARPSSFPVSFIVC